MGSISRHSAQVTAKNSIKIRSRCFGTETETNVGTESGSAEGVISTLACNVGAGITARVDGEHAVTRIMNIAINGRNFRNIWFQQ